VSIKVSDLRNKYFIEPKHWTTTQTQEWLHQLGPWANTISIGAKKLNLSNYKNEQKINLIQIN
jgi:hypothetical protein